MPPENCTDSFALHDYQLQQHSDALQKLDGVPAALKALHESIARVNQTMDRIDAKAQTQAACAETHRALETLRAEQLVVLRKNIQENAEAIDDHTEQIKDNTDEISEIRGVLKFLKWSIPVAVAISPGIATVVLKIFGK